MSDRPIRMTWDGEALRPRGPAMQALADEQFVVGASHMVELVKERHMGAHNHYFACIAKAWENLPEDEIERFPDPLTLRKWALIRAGFRNEHTMVYASNAEALRQVPFLRSMGSYCVVVVRGAVATVLTPVSQSRADMSAADFKASKRAVLGVIAKLIGVDPQQLLDEADGGGRGK